ncbi:hypothetical protein OIV83_001018 [Microbotryomycetes sp. JL201]|nr:hypothetical protein OIV83_001018 [Microbotryomycetes sp. JL201]
MLRFTSTSKAVLTSLAHVRWQSSTGAQQTIEQALRDALKVNMRARNTFAVQTIKSVLSDLQNQLKLPNPPSELKVLTRSITQRKDAAKVFMTASPPRQDLAEQNDKEAQFLEGFVPPKPEGLAEAELDQLVMLAVGETGVQEVNNKTMGQIIKAVMAKAAGRTDGASVAAAVRRHSQR